MSASCCDQAIDPRRGDVRYRRVPYLSGKTDKSAREVVYYFSFIGVFCLTRIDIGERLPVPKYCVTSLGAPEWCHTSLGLFLGQFPIW